MISVLARLLFLPIIIYWLGKMSLELASIAFEASSVVKVDGLLNIAGVYGMLLVTCYLFVWWLNQLIKNALPVGDFSKVTGFLLLVVTPLATTVTYQA
ncbi:hypothetical protein [Vibrio mexicanus]|uniref:hypothetical protein n=1 Tax=Vibrio mexicanus TaxID=1004326 RepID=UPI00063C17CF|nr:hypothetical protein [Vibrio mexicanus]